MRLLRSRTELLLVCQPGGHLAELLVMRPVWSARTRAWLTLSSPDAHSALSGERVFYGFGPTPRSLLRLMQNTYAALVVLIRVRPRWIITTGAALAVPAAWLGRLFGARTIYVECAGRVETISLSMRLIAPVARAVYVQWPEQASLLRKAVCVGQLPHRVASEPLRERRGPVVAIAGTTPYPFDRFVALVDELAASVPVRMQTGTSRKRPQHANAVDYLSPGDLQTACVCARAIVTHGGIGSAMTAWATGIRPILVPRRKLLGENVDDHQVEFSRRLEQLGLAFVAEDAESLAALVAEGQNLRVPSLPEDNRLLNALHSHLAIPN